MIRFATMTADPKSGSYFPRKKSIMVNTFPIAAADFREVAGPEDKYIKFIEAQLAVKISYDGENQILVIRQKGNPKDAGIAQRAILALMRLEQERHISVKPLDVNAAVATFRRGASEDDFLSLYEQISVDAKGNALYAKNHTQVKYLHAVKSNDLTFAIGPAGTGKTFLAIVAAVCALKKRQVEKIILTRPIVEAGENLGFLPGGIREKVDPYFAPVYDALTTLLGKSGIDGKIKSGIIEIAPLAYMRGRTFNNSFIILDEAQNTTPKQMKMFLTRFGMGSKMAITGDETQVDLQDKTLSGLVDAKTRIQKHNIPHIGFVNFTANDVMRHPIVAEIVKAYEE